MKATFEITPEILATAKPRDSGSCAVTLAVKARFPEEVGIFTTPGGIHFRSIGSRFHGIPLPSDMQAYVRDFDSDIHMEPRSFELDLPEDFHALLKP